MKRAFKGTDLIIIFFSLGLTALAAYVAYFMPRGTSRVIIRGQGAEWSFPLDANEVVVVPGPIGNTVVRLYENRVRVLSSPCLNQSCVTSNSVSLQGQWIACLPNNVLVVIHGVDEENVDAISW